MWFAITCNENVCCLEADSDSIANETESIGPFPDPNEYETITAYKRLVDELLDPDYYEKTVHPRRNFNLPTRVNLSMSLYQVLEVVHTRSKSSRLTKKM